MTAREHFDTLYGHLYLSDSDAAWHVFQSGYYSATGRLNDDVIPQAAIAAEMFCQERKNELHIFTLRKAYEMGYLKGYNDGTR
jgi:hypothetical protein